MIPSDFIETVLARTDIVEIVEPRVSLKRTGQNYTGLCPFHNEKSPSFSVSQNKQFYYCFGCQANGNALKFLMEFDRMEFVPAVEYLASRAGLEVPQSSPAERQRAVKRKGLYDILDESSAWFREQLRKHPEREKAVAYLKGRGLSGEIARDFALGFAPSGWDNLLRKLATSNHDRELLIESGMIIEATDEDKTWDRFRSRIIFPIRDTRGRTLAFGGRVLSDNDKPKYLNSPESPVFHKSRELYGLYEARQRVRNLEQLLVVEGYMDVVALAQHGLGYSVATLGTATSKEHIERMFRMVPRVVFCFDGDAAGRNAAWKALNSTLPAMQDGKSAKFLFLPDGEDPDTLVRKEGREAFEARMAEATDLADFMFSSLSSEIAAAPSGESGEKGGAALGDKAALSKAAAPLIRQMPEGVFKQLMIDRLAELTGLSLERLLSALSLDKPLDKPSDDPPHRRDASGAMGHGGQAREAAPEEYGRPLETDRPKRPGTIDQAVALLLHQPEAAISLEDDQVRELQQQPDWQLLARMVTHVRDHDLISSVVLLSEYQDTEHFEYLRKLAERDMMLTPDQLAEEFRNVIDRLLMEAHLKIQRVMVEEAMKKSPASLTEEERKVIAAYTQNSHASKQHRGDNSPDRDNVNSPDREAALSEGNSPERDRK